MKEIGILKIIWELKFWKLFENWSFENYLKIGVLKIRNLKNWIRNWSFENDLKIEVLKNKSGYWSFENWNFEKLNLEIEVLKIIWKLKYWKLNLKIGILKNYLRMKFFWK